MSRISRVLLWAQVLLLGVPVAAAFVLAAGYVLLLTYAGWSIGIYMVPLFLVWSGAAGAILSFFVLAVTALRKGRRGLRSCSGWPWLGVAVGSIIAIVGVCLWLMLEPRPENRSMFTLFLGNLRNFMVGALLLPATLQLAIERLRNEV